MAEKLGITRNGYAIAELLDNKSICCQIRENHSNTINYNSDQNLTAEIERLKLSLFYKDELLI